MKIYKFTKTGTSGHTAEKIFFDYEENHKTEELIHEYEAEELARKDDNFQVNCYELDTIEITDQNEIDGLLRK